MTSFKASGNLVPFAVAASFMHFSIVYCPFRILSMALRACFGSTSVRNPLTPMFMASIGGSGFGMVAQVLRIVPSPPMVIMKSVFIFLKGTNFSLTFILSANVSSI